MSLVRSVEVAVVEEAQRRSRMVVRRRTSRCVGGVSVAPRAASASRLGAAAMTYSIVDSTGNLVNAFNDRATALDCLAGIAQAALDRITGPARR
jgi:hypothetical protein